MKICMTIKKENVFFFNFELEVQLHGEMQLFVLFMKLFNLSKIFMAAVAKNLEINRFVNL